MSLAESRAELRAPEATESNAELLREYAAYLRVERGLRPLSVEAYGRDLLQFAEFLEGVQATVITARGEQVSGFLKHLREHGVESRTVARKLSCLRGFYKWLLLDKRIRHDPTMNVESATSWKVLPKSLAESQVNEMLERTAAAARLGDADGLVPRGVRLRDWALLELLYAGGLRASEVSALRQEDLRLLEGSVQVRGKGDKERIVPLGRTAMEALERYLEQGRPELLGMAKLHGPGIQRLLFLSSRGSRLRPQAVWEIVKQAGKAAGVHASPHQLRHSCATHMVQHGADLRTVQTLLGHADIATTQVYTHLAADRLKVVHRSFHPRGRRVAARP